MSNSEIVQLLDEKPLTFTQMTVVALCATIALMDGFDTQAIGYVAPAIVQSWAISKLALGPLFSAGLIGSVLGALIFGSLADRFGRRLLLIFCTVVFGCGALASSFANSLLMLSALRFLTGLGMGGAMPVAIAQTSEFMPTRVRGIMVTLTYCGFSVGAALGGVAASQLIERFGWRSVFVMGGLLPLLLVGCLVLWLPESIEFLVTRNGSDAKASSLLHRLGIPTAKLREMALRSFERRPRTPVGLGHLFNGAHAILTPVIWLIVFMNLVELYFFSNWLPTMIHGAGIHVGHAALITALFQVGGTVGALVIGRLIDRFRKFQVMASSYLAAAILVGLVGFLLSRIGVGSPGIVLFAIAVTLTGACVVGAQIGIVAVASTIYPAAIRSSGVGWALGVGRTGSIVGPLVGSVLIAAKFDNTKLFVVGAIPVLIAALLSIFADRLRLHRNEAPDAPTGAVDSPLSVP
jgi:MFS transporter, AAHS family, 4-hydroxybenzoate transporter